MNTKKPLIALLYKWVSYAFELRMKFENIILQQVKIEPSFKAQEMGTKYLIDFCPQSHLNKSLESLGQNYEGLEGDGGSIYSIMKINIWWFIGFRGGSNLEF